MKENILDVLLYLFENFVYDDPDSLNDRDSLQANLLEAGFSPSEISKAFDWLDVLARERPQLTLREPPAGSSAPVRVHAAEEIAKLDAECRGFLMFLEHSGVIDAERRELVLDRIMALDADEVDLDDLKWIVLMVLFSQPGQEAACAFLEIDLLESEGEALN